MRVLIYLTSRLFINSLRNIASSPKKLIPAIFIGLWLTMTVGANIIISVFSHVSRSNNVLPMMTFLPAQYDAIWAVVFSLLACLVIYIIQTALSEGALVFTPAQIDFLFPSPVDRRGVLALKLLGDYLKYAIYTALFLMLVGQMLIMTGRTPMHLGSWLGIVCLLALTMNITHTVKIVTSYGAKRLQIATIAIKLIVAIAVVLVVAALVMHYQDTKDPMLSFAGAVAAGPVRMLLLPVAWCTDLVVSPFGGDVANSGRELLYLFGLAALSAVVLIMRPENYYESSLTVSARTARMRVAARTGGWAAIKTETRKIKGRTSYTSSPIPPIGTGAFAIFWKSMVIATRSSGSGWIMFAAGLPIVCALAGKYITDTEIQSFFMFVIPYIAWGLAVGSMTQTRNELCYANTIKTMPISGMRILGAIVLKQWMIAAMVIGLTGACMIIFLPGMDSYYVGSTTVAAITAMISSMSSLQILVMLYPDAKDKMQQMIPNMFAMLFVVLAALPSVIIGAIALAVKLNLLITFAILAVVNAGVTWGALTIAGGMFSRFDPTSE